MMDAFDAAADDDGDNGEVDMEDQRKPAAL